MYKFHNPKKISALAIFKIQQKDQVPLKVQFQENIHDLDHV